MRKLPKVIRYDICIKSNEILHIVGRFFVKVYEGELMFIPTLRYVRKDKAKLGEEIEHFAWHSSGRYHIKKKGGTYDIIQPRESSSPLRETGLQPLLRIHLKNLDQLKTKLVADRLDVILSSDTCKEELCVEISLMSGRWLLQNKPETGFGSIMSPEVLAGLLSKDMRFIGQHSDNADKIIQFFLAKVALPDADPAVNVMMATFPYQKLFR